jgi:hypothetical protein
MLVESDQQLRSNLAARTFRDYEKAREFRSRAAFEALRNVGHHGQSRTSYLIYENYISGESSRTAHAP